MDFAPTEEQRMIRDIVRHLPESVPAPPAAERDREQRPPVAAFNDFAALGFAGMTIPEAYGGHKRDYTS